MEGAGVCLAHLQLLLFLLIPHKKGGMAVYTLSCGFFPVSLDCFYVRICL